MAPGRPASGDRDFVVIARIVTHFPPGSEKEMLPLRQRLRNTLDTYSFREENRIEQVEHGLSCYRTTLSTAYSVMCITPSGSDPEVILRSSWSRRDQPSGPPNPTLATEIFSRHDGLSIFLNFPEVAFGRWSDVVCQTLTLIRSWEMTYGSRSGCPAPQVS
jgi:hypothetical protein